MSHIHSRAQASWDAKAEEWHQQVGDEGDRNRRFNSDPVLWRFIGPVDGLRVLDAGCGTGYLSIKLARGGAHVVGVDHSSGMIEVARRRVAECGLDIELHVASCSLLEPVASESMDCVVSNYVLMDLHDMPGAVREFHRVLRPGGRAVLIFSHPAFSAPDGGIGRMLDGSMVYRWGRSYFDEYEYEERWGHFTTSFIAFHRPLSAYWRAFTRAGFQVLEFDEPAADEVTGAELTADALRAMRMTPNSVAFLLGKKEG